MAIRKIMTEKDDILHKKSRPVEKFDEKLAVLLGDMAETMHRADGCGLAAVQVGILRRAVVVDVGGGVIELVNPKIVDTKGEQRSVEGCLSYPGLRGVTIRPAWVKVKACDRNGREFTVEGEGLKAKAFCHEIDHLDGITFQEHIIEEVD